MGFHPRGTWGGLGAVREQPMVSFEDGLIELSNKSRFTNDWIYTAYQRAMLSESNLSESNLSESNVISPKESQYNPSEATWVLGLDFRSCEIESKSSCRFLG
jgi:hypothetical protein